METNTQMQSVATKLVAEANRLNVSIDDVDIATIDGASALSQAAIADVFELARKTVSLDATPAKAARRKMSSGKRDDVQLLKTSNTAGTDAKTIATLAATAADPSIPERTVGRAFKALNAEAKALATRRNQNPELFVYRNTEGQSRSDRLADLAWKLDGLGDARGAIAIYDAALVHDPSHAVLKNRRAIAIKHTGDLVHAEAEFEGVLELKPHYPPAAYNLACTRSQLGDDGDAIYSQLADAIGSSETPQQQEMFRRMALNDSDFGKHARSDLEFYELVTPKPPEHPSDLIAFLAGTNEPRHLTLNSEELRTLRTQLVAYAGAGGPIDAAAVVTRLMQAERDGELTINAPSGALNTVEGLWHDVESAAKVRDRRIAIRTMR